MSLFVYFVLFFEELNERLNAFRLSRLRFKLLRLLSLFGLLELPLFLFRLFYYFLITFGLNSLDSL